MTNDDLTELLLNIDQRLVLLADSAQKLQQMAVILEKMIEKTNDRIERLEDRVYNPIDHE